MGKRFIRQGRAQGLPQSLLSQKLIDQQAEAQELASEKSLVSRVQLPALLELLDTKFIKIVMGIRRSGKSTLVLQAVKSRPFVYINFDDEVLSQTPASQLKELFETAVSMFPQAKIFVFDEIQNVDGWELFINRLHRRKVNLLLTGSNSHLLSRDLATHLTGRQISLELFPFSFEEYLRLKKIEPPQASPTTQQVAELSKAFQDFFEIGGFPEVQEFPSASMVSRRYLQELYDKIISRDVVQRRGIKHIKSFREVSLLLQSLFSSQFTFQSLKRASTLNSVNTVKNYVDYVQEAYLGFVLEPFAQKMKERISLPKKFYTIDVALAQAVVRPSSPDLGKKLENLVFLELRRRGREIFYFKSAKHEVDFLIREGRAVTELIQVSWTLADEHTREREIQGLLFAAKKLKVKTLFVVTAFESETLETDSAKIHIVPAWQWLLQGDALTN